jgi:DNA topoisomerase-1
MATKRERAVRLAAAAELPVEPQDAARAAHLRYVTDTRPGIRRRKRGRAFSYYDADGQRVHDDATLARIKALAIPPAWTDVWICADPRGHIQATGRDAKGRKQYRYHARWQAVRDETKYGRMIAFGDALPRIHQRTSEHLRLPGLPREKVLAAIVRLLEATLIRVGNAEYARNNHSFGLTTLRDRHVDVAAGSGHVRFEFRGKHGKRHSVDLKDRRLARVIKQCRDIPGQELFQYLDDEGNRHTVESTDVNNYLRELTGEDFTAKDFRTWAGTVLAAQALAELGAAESGSDAQRKVVQAVEQVAQRLGNTPAVCRKCYIHPAVVDAYLGGAAIDVLSSRAGHELMRDGELEPAERAVLRHLRAELRRQAQSAA